MNIKLTGCGDFVKTLLKIHLVAKRHFPKSSVKQTFSQDPSMFHFFLLNCENILIVLRHWVSVYVFSLPT